MSQYSCVAVAKQTHLQRRVVGSSGQLFPLSCDQSVGVLRYACEQHARLKVLSGKYGHSHLVRRVNLSDGVTRPRGHDGGQYARLGVPQGDQRSAQARARAARLLAASLAGPGPSASRSRWHCVALSPCGSHLVLLPASRKLKADGPNWSGEGRPITLRVSLVSSRN